MVGQTVGVPPVGGAVGLIEESALVEQEGGAIGRDGDRGFVAIGVAEVHKDGGG